MKLRRFIPGQSGDLLWSKSSYAGQRHEWEYYLL